MFVLIPSHNCVGINSFTRPGRCSASLRNASCQSADSDNTEYNNDRKENYCHSECCNGKDADQNVTDDPKHQTEHFPNIIKTRMIISIIVITSIKQIFLISESPARVYQALFFLTLTII